jgi:hypothetical protein
MNILISKSIVRILSAISILFGLSLAQNAMASEHVTACKDHIQNKIAWDSNSPYHSSSKWTESSLESLCKGTKNPKEPGECFQKVMTGHVKWGDSDKWDWKNAVTLCAGTDNSDERISCFKGRIAAGEKWDAAVLQCQSSGKIVIQ